MRKTGNGKGRNSFLEVWTSPSFQIMKDHQSATAKARKIPVCSPKPSEAPVSVFQHFFSFVRCFHTLFCHLLVLVCQLPVLGLYNPGKNKKATACSNWFSPWEAGKTITGLETTFSPSNLGAEVHFILCQKYCPSSVNFYGFIWFLWLYRGSDQKQSSHHQT